MTLTMSPRLVLLGAVFVLSWSAVHATSVTPLYAFPNPTQGAYSPQASLLKEGPDCYGTTYWGGQAGRGTVFKLDPATGKQTILHAFNGPDGANPDAALISASGVLYGTTYAGGTSGRGTVFTIDPKSGALTTLHSFAGPDGAYPAAALYLDGGTLYGTATAGGDANNGTVFTIDMSTGAEATLYSFAATNDGATPSAGLIKVGSLLYGTTTFSDSGAGVGTIYQIDPTSGAEKVLAGFGGLLNGGEPMGPMIDVGGILYGTGFGVYGNFGNVFGFNPATGVETSIYNFAGGPNDGAGPASALVASGGMLYGTTENGGAGGVGTIFQINPATGTETVIASFTGANGASPLSAMVLAKGSLYGTTSSAGYYSNGPMDGLPTSLPGTVFKLVPSTGALKTLTTFPGINPVFQNISSLLVDKSVLAGTTAQGGPSGHSAVFTINRKSGVEDVLADLGSSDLTKAGLIKMSSKYYGTTATGGSAGFGTVFSVDPSTGTQATLYAFTDGTDGADPAAQLLGSGGALYGTTQFGGQNFGGTVFKVDPATGVETTLYGFSYSTDGGDPTSSLIDVSGELYGTAMYGGASGGGVLFANDPSANSETTVYSFTGFNAPYMDGVFPSTAPTNVGGILFGTTPYGGPNLAACGGFACGVAYAVDPKTGVESVLHIFTGGVDGGIPEGMLLNVNGTLYGTTTAGGASGYGTIFTIAAAAGTFTTIYSFTGGNDGATPVAGLSQSGGKLYGTTNFGGPGNAGTVFTLAP